MKASLIAVFALALLLTGCGTADTGEYTEETARAIIEASEFIGGTIWGGSVLIAAFCGVFKAP